MTDGKKGFVLYKSMYEPINEDLSLEEKGMLLDAIFQYQTNGSIFIENDKVKIAFNFIKSVFEMDEKKYQEKIVKRNQINGAKGGRKPKKPSGLKKTQPNPTEPKKADIVMDIVMDMDIDINNKNINKKFDEFWEMYPIKNSKKKAKELYVKHATRHEKIMKGLQAYVGYINHLAERKKHDSRQFVPSFKDPTTWLRNECWNDEYTDSYRAEIKKISQNEEAKRQEEKAEYKRRADQIFGIFRTGYLNKRFGENGWSIHPPIGKMMGGSNKFILTQNPEVNQELLERFKTLHPQEYNVLFNNILIQQ